MLALVACVSVLPIHACARTAIDRADFFRKLAAVQDGWSKTRVRALLGKPGDVWPPNDSIHYGGFGYETWCYGTSGHHTMWTLGSVTFRHGKVSQTSGDYGSPPSTAVIGDAELTRYLRRLYRPLGDTQLDETLRIIQVTNDLVPLGKQKAVAILGEFSRVAEPWGNERWLFLLSEVLFEPNELAKRPLGNGGLEPPHELLGWTRWPVILIDDVPVSVTEPGSVAGRQMPFWMYLQEHEKEWSMRTRPLEPTNDPFLTYGKIITSAAANFLRLNERANEPKYSERTAFANIVSLVKSAYRSPDTYDELTQRSDTINFARFREEFLKLRCHWDSLRQIYVRGDGSFTADEYWDYLQQMFQFRPTPQLEVNVTFSRSDPTHLDIQIETHEFGSQKIPNAIVVFLDPDSGHEYARVAPNTPVSSEVFRAESYYSAILSEPPHAPDDAPRGALGLRFEFSLKPSKRIQLKMLFNGRTYKSPVFKP